MGPSCKRRPHLDLVEIITAEAIKTSEIEGVYFDRASVQSSVRCAFGLSAERRQGVRGRERCC